MTDDFLNYLKYEKRRSELTVKSYAEDLKAFESYFNNLGTHLSWASIEPHDIRSWMESMMDKGNSATSINRRLSALRSFYRFALSRSLVTKDPASRVVGPKKAKPLPQFLKEKEMDRLFDDCYWDDDYRSVRDRTILMVFYETGVRLSELVGLNDEDVDFLQGQLKVTGKRNKQRIVPFGKGLEAALKAFIECRDASLARNDKALFVRESGERVSADAVRKSVAAHLSRVSTLSKRSPHVLRHTFATALLNHRADIENVRQLLGHTSLKATEIYTHTTFEHLKSVYKAAHPRADSFYLKKGDNNGN